MKNFFKVSNLIILIVFLFVHATPTTLETRYMVVLAMGSCLYLEKLLKGKK